eukprot:CAMPEP_0196600298 /NCGR_PEP_ID=MMETSP1081-20130531/95313_1 /TAXON_ID=36882 /ORGANISM="Pyramimonas amylifera, Strain CCMP720" /LENGTH=579 /DNA_ID=CAMNT_0041926129 /DNA_START=334 /DNA_END=2073 /DNA_ORIENTATION=+
MPSVNQGMGQSMMQSINQGLNQNMNQGMSQGFNLGSSSPMNVGNRNLTGSMMGGGLADMDALRHQAALQAGDLRARFSNDSRGVSDMGGKKILYKSQERETLSGKDSGSRGPTSGKVDFKTRLEEEKKKKRESDSKRDNDAKRKKEDDSRRERELKLKREEDFKKKKLEETNMADAELKAKKDLELKTKKESESIMQKEMDLKLKKETDEKKRMADEDRKSRGVNGTVAVAKIDAFTLPAEAKGVQAELQRQIATLSQQAQHAKQGLAIQTRLSEERKEQVERSEKAAKESRVEARAARDKADKLTKDLHDLNAKLSNNQRDLSQVKDQLKNRDEEKKALDKEASKLRMEAARLEGQLTEVRKQADHQVEEAREVARNLHARLHQRENEILQLQSQNNPTQTMDQWGAAQPTIGGMGTGSQYNMGASAIPTSNASATQSSFPNAFQDRHQNVMAEMNMGQGMSGMANMGGMNMGGMGERGGEFSLQGEHQRGAEWMAAGGGGISGMPPWQQQQLQQQQQITGQPPLPLGAMMHGNSAGASGGVGQKRGADWMAQMGQQAWGTHQAAAGQGNTPLGKRIA